MCFTLKLSFLILFFSRGLISMDEQVWTGLLSYHWINKKRFCEVHKFVLNVQNFITGFPFEIYMSYSTGKWNFNIFWSAKKIFDTYQVYILYLSKQLHPIKNGAFTSTTSTFPNIMYWSSIIRIKTDPKDVCSSFPNFYLLFLWSLILHSRICNTILLASDQ